MKLPTLIEMSSILKVKVVDIYEYGSNPNFKDDIILYKTSSNGDLKSISNKDFIEKKKTFFDNNYDILVKFIEWDGKENEILTEVLEDSFFYNKGESFMFDPFVNSKSFDFSDTNKYQLYEVDYISSAILCSKIIAI